MDILFSLVILVFSAILHEIMHGYVADRLGDPTARIMGRLTLNPLPHIDPLMTLAIPILLVLTGSPVVFGGAKPVPVDVYNLREGRKDLAIVALAGPLTNLTLALIAALLFHTLQAEGVVQLFLWTVVRINVMLAIFNLLPLPPLDGSKLFSLLLPERTAETYLSIGELGTFLLFFLLMTPIGPFSLQDFLFHLYQTAITLLGF